MFSPRPSFRAVTSDLVDSTFDWAAIIACGSFCWFDRKPAQPLRCTVNFTNLKAKRPEEGKVMNAATLHYCPLCRTPHPSYGAVRAHLDRSPQAKDDRGRRAACEVRST